MAAEVRYFLERHNELIDDMNVRVPFEEGGKVGVEERGQFILIFKNILSTSLETLSQTAKFITDRNSVIIKQSILTCSLNFNQWK